ncbi:MAG: hypothetical protein VX938_00805 [Myxococcota bacterium]|nr:hypothetical protein [Myxococcota bacterium]
MSCSRPWLLAILLWTGIHMPCSEASAALPSADRLFGCPLAANPSEFIPPSTWAARRVKGMTASLLLPPDWRLEGDRPVARATSADGQTSVSVRRQSLSGSAGLALARSLMEFRELGPSHTGQLCATTLSRQVDGLGLWRGVQVSTYGRPLGERRRSFALYAHRGTEIYSVVITTRWSRKAEGPDLRMVRRLLGALRPDGAAGEMAQLEL